MTTMTISPIQFNKNHVTKGEFGEHTQYVKDGFEKVFEQVDNVETILTNRIDLLETNMDKRFDAVDTRLESVDKHLDSLDKQLGLLTTQVTLLTKVTDKLSNKL